MYIKISGKIKTGQLRSREQILKIRFLEEKYVYFTYSVHIGFLLAIRTHARVLFKESFFEIHTIKISNAPIQAK